MTPSIFPRECPAEPVRIGVVGLGYWGPNLIRNLNELDERRPALDLRPRPVAARHVRSAVPDRPRHARRSRI